jgi:hypothetical protein
MLNENISKKIYFVLESYHPMYTLEGFDLATNLLCRVGDARAMKIDYVNS